MILSSKQGIKNKEQGARVMKISLKLRKSVFTLGSLFFNK